MAWGQVSLLESKHNSLIVHACTSQGLNSNYNYNYNYNYAIYPVAKLIYLASSILKLSLHSRLSFTVLNAHSFPKEAIAMARLSYMERTL